MLKELRSTFLKLAVSVCALSLLGCGGGGSSGSGNTPLPVASSSSSVKAITSKFETVSFVAPSLSANLIGESTTRQIDVYLPKEYFTSDARLPVVYYLPGFGNTSIYTDLDVAFKAAQPSIVVIVSGVNKYGGSFFVDSSVTGKWAEYVYKDVVGYVDAHYRTLAKRESRGIAGHSMGGFGALNLAMRHSDVFGSVFSLSPGLVGADGISDTQLFDQESHIKSFMALIASTKDLSGIVWPNNFDIAYGMAFAPSAVPPYFEYPYTSDGNSLILNKAVLEKWETGFGNVHSEVVEFKESLKSLNGIQLDCGSNEEYQWIYRGCNYYDAELTAAGIDHTYTTHTGRHGDRLPERVITVMIPFFSQHLAAK